MKKTVYLIVGLLVFSLLLGCGGGEEQRRQLAELERMNRADSVMRNDSLAESLVAYFDRHGTANERMRAYYMLGRTYFDLGELPRALETYLIAADCADTTSADCDYKTLSRIHTQEAKVYDSQVLPRNGLGELIKAVYYAKRGRDTIQAIECYSRQAECYKLLNLQDSAILVLKEASESFLNVGLVKRAAGNYGGMISIQIRNGDIKGARKSIDIYEKNSGFWDLSGDVQKGREIYYYIKGNYYLTVNQLDSAEYMFRKELRDGKDLNNQIAGSRGLQEVYTKRGISDSIAKYANISYLLNDSAYSLSEMENIQKLSASYNYEHNKQIAKEKEIEAERANMRIVVFISIVLIAMLVTIIAFIRYKHRKDTEFAQYQKDLEILERTQTELSMLQSENEDISEVVVQQKQEIALLQDRIEIYRQKKLRMANDLEMMLNDAPIVVRLKELNNANPPKTASIADIRDLKTLINELIPTFYSTMNSDGCVLRPIEYEVSLLTRCHFKSADICRLLDRTDGYIANLKKTILRKSFGIEGMPKDFDQKVHSIK